MVRNIIFDLGGVVLGRDFDRCDAIALRCLSFLRGEQFPQCWTDFDRGVVSREQVARDLASLSGDSPQQVLAYIEAACGALTAFAPTVSLIRRLHAAGYPLYVLSNMPDDFWQVIRHFEVFDYFSGVVISSVEHLVKPDPAFFRLLLDRYGLQAQESLFVDDKFTNLQAAKAIGFQTFHFLGRDGGESAARLAELLPGA